MIPLRVKIRGDGTALGPNRDGDKEVLELPDTSFTLDSAFARCYISSYKIALYASFCNMPHPADSTQNARLQSALDKQPLVRAFELRQLGIDATTISRAVESGDLVRIARGLYQKSDGEVDGEQALAEASRLAPKAVIAMLSALAYHGITDQMPRRVWLAIGSKDWAPKISYPPVHYVRLGPSYLNSSIEHHMISGVSVPIYGIAKSLADVFRHPKLIDRSAAVDSLRQTLVGRKATPAQIAEAAKAGRVWKIVQPYLEAMASHG